MTVTISTLSRLLIAIALATVSVCGWAQRWSYVDPGGERNSFVIEANPTRTSVGHVLSDARLCAESESFRCFEGSGIAFAVPKVFNATKGFSWKFGGNEYVVSGQVDLQILGQSLQVLHIDSKTQNPQLRFHYSIERGLVAIEGLCEECRSIWILEESCGFAAEKPCSQP